MKRPSYREAIEWLADGDTDWLTDENERDLDGKPFWDITAVMVADLFRVPNEKVAEDILKRLKKRDQYNDL